MSVYSISMYVCSELASIGARARQLETDARKRRNIDCVQDTDVRVLFATFVPNNGYLLSAHPTLLFFSVVYLTKAGHLILLSFGRYTGNCFIKV